MIIKARLTSPLWSAVYTLCPYGKLRVCSLYQTHSSPDLRCSSQSVLLKVSLLCVLCLLVVCNWRNSSTHFLQLAADDALREMERNQTVMTIRETFVAPEPIIQGFLSNSRSWDEIPQNENVSTCRSHRDWVWSTKKTMSHCREWSI